MGPGNRDGTVERCEFRRRRNHAGYPSNMGVWPPRLDLVASGHRCPPPGVRRWGRQRRRSIGWDQLRENCRKTVHASADLIAHARRMMQFSEDRLDAGSTSAIPRSIRVRRGADARRDANGRCPRNPSRRFEPVARVGGHLYRDDNAGPRAALRLAATLAAAKLHAERATHAT
jgi:hypothetical protein